MSIYVPSTDILTSFTLNHITCQHNSNGLSLDEQTLFSCNLYSLHKYIFFSKTAKQTSGSQVFRFSLYNLSAIPIDALSWSMGMWKIFLLHFALASSQSSTFHVSRMHTSSYFFIFSLVYQFSTLSSLCLRLSSSHINTSSVVSVLFFKPAPLSL